MRPPPYGLRGLAECVLVGHSDLELLVDVYRVDSNDLIDCLLNFIGIFVVRELRGGLGDPQSYMILRPVLVMVIKNGALNVSFRIHKKDMTFHLSVMPKFC